jgi:hypothetical protein
MSQDSPHTTYGSPSELTTFTNQKLNGLIKDQVGMCQKTLAETSCDAFGTTKIPKKSVRI